jgi:autotransporter-associated beta strand protein
LLLALDAALSQTTYTWSGGSSGSGDAWRQANNWRPSPGQGGPGPGGVAFFGAAGASPSIGINFNDGRGLLTTVDSILLGSGSSRDIYNSAPNSSGTLRVDGASGLVLANDTESSWLRFSNGAGSMMKVAFSSGGEIRVGSSSAGISLGSEVAGAQGFVKTGAGALRLSHSNSLGGGVVVAAGTLELASAAGSSLGSVSSLRLEAGAAAVLANAHQIGDATSLVLAGGTLRGASSAAVADETIGRLTLSASSTIDLGDSRMLFANSSSIVWVPAATLTITNWRSSADGNAGRLFFGTGGLSSTQLAQIYFADLGVHGAQLVGPRGELVPIPEAPVFAAAALLALFVLWRERGRIAGFLLQRRRLSDRALHPIAVTLACIHHGRVDQSPSMNKRLLFPSAAIALAALAVVLISEFTTAQESDPGPLTSGPDIVAVMTADPDLTTLVSALRAAELVDTLKGGGPFTVFAPNNAAFAKLPQGTLDSLMMPQNKKKLAAILKNHVIREKTAAADVTGGRERTLGGGKVELTKSDGKISFGGASVLIADMEASNGTVHVINAVVMPD